MGGGGRGEIMGCARPIFLREKGWAKREIHDGWGWVIVCFVKNHTQCNSGHKIQHNSMSRAAFQAKYGES